MAFGRHTNRGPLVPASELDYRYLAGEAWIAARYPSRMNRNGCMMMFPPARTSA
jgi:hypothetical protein